MIYYSTDARKNEIYLLNRIISLRITSLFENRGGGGERAVGTHYVKNNKTWDLPSLALNNLFHTAKNEQPIVMLIVTGYHNILLLFKILNLRCFHKIIRSYCLL